MEYMTTDDNEHDKMSEILSLTKENNRILRAMHRSMIWGQVFTMIYWIIILGGIGASYYYLQPYLTQYIGTYQSLMSTIDSMQTTGQSIPADIEGLLDKVR